jgi:hypothetical protein
MWVIYLIILAVLTSASDANDQGVVQITNEAFNSLIKTSTKVLKDIDEKMPWQKILIKELESHRSLNWFKLIDEIDRKFDPHAREALHDRIVSWSLRDSALFLPLSLPNR